MSSATLRSQETVAGLPPLMVRNTALLLSGVTWEGYRALRDDPRNDGLRLYYSDGEMLLKATGTLHEQLAAAWGLVLTAWARSTNTRLKSFGRWTMQRGIGEKGLEADNCYYVSNLSTVQGKESLELEHDPPPDLAIEIDVSTNSTMKFDIYAVLKIPEVWVWNGTRMLVYRLKDQRYQEVSASVELQGFPMDQAVSYVLDHYAEDDANILFGFLDVLNESQ
jgi:Uma2 family endonuclease